MLQKDEMHRVIADEIDQTIRPNDHDATTFPARSDRRTRQGKALQEIDCGSKVGKECSQSTSVRGEPPGDELAE